MVPAHRASRPTWHPHPGREPSALPEEWDRVGVLPAPQLESLPAALQSLLLPPETLPRVCPPAGLGPAVTGRCLSSVYTGAAAAPAQHSPFPTPAAGACVCGSGTWLGGGTPRAWRVLSGQPLCGRRWVPPLWGVCPPGLYQTRACWRLPSKWAQSQGALREASLRPGSRSHALPSRAEGAPAPLSSAQHRSAPASWACPWKAISSPAAPGREWEGGAATFSQLWGQEEAKRGCRSEADGLTLPGAFSPPQSGRRWVAVDGDPQASRAGITGPWWGFGAPQNSAKVRIAP